MARAAIWRDWLARLEALVPRVIRQPLVVPRVLAELRPMGAIGPVTLREVRDVLSERLRTVAVEPPDSRYGRVFVGTTDQAAGRVFRVVFVPGLAERVFPQKLREDPLLADAVRRRSTPALRPDRQSRRRGAPAAPARHRRGDRARVHLVPARSSCARHVRASRRSMDST